MIGGCLSQRSQHCLLHQLSKHALVHLQMKCKPAQQQQKKLRVSSLFTGIVQGKGHVKQVHKQHEFSSINIQFPTGRTDAIQTGASVAINGTCLTVTSQDHDTLTFDIIKETLRATNLGQLQQGSEVNFERSARMGDEIGGHHVSGHVHTTAQVRQIEDTENNRRLTFQVRFPRSG
ncbi:hypothetical protein ABBQ32_007646 [Trebouxia sp. C0010 RCD-2024]